MKSEGKNLGGRKYLEKKLVEIGLSRRRSVQVLNLLFKAMNQALARDEAVEFAGGKLTRVKKLSRHWELLDDEPMNPWTVEWELTREGWKQLFGAESAAEEEWRFTFWEAPAPEKRERRGRKKAARKLVSK
ncbi:hypothetical protein P8935_05240 [Telmatobacter sp. DSM 110680]|uniref:Uncharacterized protein n=1 Tax=Telmatobacter sp. DSM 110680 TaxID=3036704 RepID=A0AAU7DN41_9BACT